MIEQSIRTGGWEIATICLDELHPLPNISEMGKEIVHRMGRNTHIELTGDIDSQHRLRAEVPPGVLAGPARIIVLLPDYDIARNCWADSTAKDGGPVRHPTGHLHNG